MALALLQQSGANAGLGLAGDPVRGKITFSKRCTGCHAIDMDREGPRLRGAFGARAGSKADFAYSEPLKKSGLTWNEINLDRWLEDSDALVPDSAMGFSVPKAQERADIIAYLRALR
jgi:cytochrome c